MYLTPFTSLAWAYQLHYDLEVGINQLWEASAYAGTCGELTTAVIKAWLRTSE